MTRVWAAILLGGIGTFTMRASFLFAAHRLVTVPPLVHRVLRQIPPAALASLVIPALLRPEGRIDVTQARLWAGLLAAAVAIRTRNTALTLVVGMSALVLFQALG